VLDRFRRLIAHQRLAHAYLFIGPEGIGKSETAQTVARMLNCRQPMTDGKDPGMPCGRCANCLRIISGNHPDVTVIDSGEEPSIKVAQIRHLISRMQMRAFESTKKIFIIKKIETLTLEGSNALLKTLEEPSKDSLLMLTTSVLEKNLATIRSRCHAVYFFPQPPRRLAAALQGGKDHDAAQAHFLAYYAEGYPARARRMRDDDFFSRKNDIINRLVVKNHDESCLKNVLADKEETRETLEVFFSLFRDLLLAQAGAGDEHAMHADRQRDIFKISRRYTFQEIQDILTEVIRTQKLLAENLNAKISMQILMEKIWQK